MKGVPADAAARTRTVSWSDPLPSAAAAKTMGGLEFLRAALRGEQPLPPMMALLGFEPVEVEEGRAVFACVPAEYHYNPIGTAHGGLACTLADTAMGCAVHSTLPEGAGYTTLELKVNFLHPITSGTGRLVCEGTTIHVGGRTAIAEARLTDEAGILYAHATATCMIFRGRTEGRSVGDGGT